MISFMLAMIMALTIPCTAFAAEKTQLTEEELWEQVANNTATVTHDVRPLSSFTQEEIEENPELQQIFNEINKDVSRSINNKTTYGEIYTTKEIYKPMTYAQDIVHVIWRADDVFLINNPACRSIVYKDKNGDVISETLIVSSDIPYVFFKKSYSESTCDFVDSLGNVIH